MEDLDLETLHAAPPNDDDDDDDADGACGGDDDDSGPDVGDRDGDRDGWRRGRAAFASASNNAATLVTLGGDVTFNATGPNRHLTPPAPGGSTFVIRRSGDYTYSLGVNGIAGNSGQPMVFELTRNGNSVAGSRFASAIPLPGAGSMISGAGTAFLVRGDVVTLRNVVNSPGGAVTLNSSLLGGANNANLSLDRVNCRRS